MAKQLRGNYDSIPGESDEELPLFKKRGAEVWLQCSSDLTSWVIQSQGKKNTNAELTFPVNFLDEYDIKLPQEMTGQWSVNLKYDKIWVKINVQFNT